LFGRVEDKFLVAEFLELFGTGTKFKFGVLEEFFCLIMFLVEFFLLTSWDILFGGCKFAGLIFLGGMGFMSGVDKLRNNGHGAFASESSVKLMHSHLSVEKKRNRIISDIMIDGWKLIN
jgi:hypothetical protein